MCSPVFYSKPKAGLVDPLATVFKTKRGSYVYAPVTGVLSAVGDDAVVTTETGYRHVLKNVRIPKAKTAGVVKSGERIGFARGRRVRYNRFGPNGKKLRTDVVVARKKMAHKVSRIFYAATMRVPTNPAGVMGPGTERKVVWHTSESEPSSGISPVADWVQMMGSQYTLIWNPYEEDRSKRFLQLYPSNAGARALKNAGDYPTNRHGRYCIQICVIGRAKDAPLATSPMYGRRELLEWLDYHRIPRKLLYNQLNPSRSRANWEMNGHTGHVACPGNDHTDPGRISKRKLFGP